MCKVEPDPEEVGSFCPSARGTKGRRTKRPAQNDRPAERRTGFVFTLQKPQPRQFPSPTVLLKFETWTADIRAWPRAPWTGCKPWIDSKKTASLRRVCLPEFLVSQKVLVYPSLLEDLRHWNKLCPKEHCESVFAGRQPRPLSHENTGGGSKCFWFSAIADAPVYNLRMTKNIPGGVAHDLPADLRKALAADSKALTAWEDITPLARNEWICWVFSVKQPEKRREHVERVCSELKEGMRRPCCWYGCVHRKDKPLSPSQKFVLTKRSKK